MLLYAIPRLYFYAILCIGIGNKKIRNDFIVMVLKLLQNTTTQKTCYIFSYNGNINTLRNCKGFKMFDVRRLY